MSKVAAEWFRANPRPHELTAILGERWAICRNTESKRQRYGRCITPKAYKAACTEALRRRALACRVITANWLAA